MAAAKKKSAAIGKQKAADAKAEKEWKAFVAKGKKDLDKKIKANKKAASVAKVLAGKAKVKKVAASKRQAKVNRAKAYKGAKKLTKGIFRMIKKSTKQSPIRRVRRVRPMPVAPVARPQQVQMNRVIAPRVVQSRPAIPNSIRELQAEPDLRKLLTPQEQVEIDRLAGRFIQRSAAMNILRRRLKEKQHNERVRNVEVSTHTDLMSGKEIVNRRIPVERWVR